MQSSTATSMSFGPARRPLADEEVAEHQADRVLGVGREGRAEEEVVDAVEQRPAVDAVPEVADAGAALVEDRAERRDLGQLGEQARGAVDDLLERRALVGGCRGRRRG